MTRSVSIPSVPALLVLVFCAASGLGQVFDTELVANGGAENVLTGWSSAGTIESIAWGAAGGFPTPASPGPPNRGVSMFAGGYGGFNSSLTQTINVAGGAATIDLGGVHFTLSAWLGGYLTQNDTAAVTAQFRNASSVVMGTATIGPVLALERGNVTGLLPKVAYGNVPIGTRSVSVVLQTATTCCYCDGYADAISLILTTGSAAIAVTGGGCNATPSFPALPTPPLLFSTVPILGQPVTIALLRGTPNKNGTLFGSPVVPAGPLPIGSGCVVTIDLATMIALVPMMTDATGAFSLTATLPTTAGLNGATIALQAALAPTLGPFGLDITNGVNLTLGY